MSAQLESTKNSQSQVDSTNTPLVYLSATQLMLAIKNKQVTSLELLEAFIERIEMLNDGINAVITRNYDAARERAKEADAALARGELWGPLHGLPMTIKDTYETTDMATSSGIRPLQAHMARKNADVVEQLLEAGAIIFGKTNVPELAMDVQTYNKLYGITNNPWNRNHTVGGSSGGSAASLASGFTALEIGSDIGGSIRIPANYCGVYGHKPSYGIVPMRGHIPGAPGQLSTIDLPVAGPMARSAEDLALALDILVKPDQFDRKGSVINLPKPRHNNLKDFKVACWLDDSAAPVDDSVKSVLDNTIESLREKGVTVDADARPGVEFQDSLNMYLKLLGGAISASINDTEFAAVSAASLVSKPLGRFGLIGNNPFYNVMQGLALSQRDWQKLNEARTKVRRKWEKFFGNYDVLLTPVTPTAAIPHQIKGNMVSRQIKVNGKRRPYINSLFWIHQATAAYLPATTAPGGLTEEGLPVGLQIIGDFMEDKTTIRFAELIEKEVVGFKQPPLF